MADPTFYNVYADFMTVRRHRRLQANRMMLWWLNRMIAATNPLPEKLTLFWHDHFATSLQKVKAPELMFRQNQLFRTMGAGRFEPLAQAVAKDAAMMMWLDSNSNQRERPNENFARELFELFTVGEGNYAEADIKAAARAFTGWRVSPRTQQFAFAPRLHDGDPPFGTAVFPAAARQRANRPYALGACELRGNGVQVDALACADRHRRVEDDDAHLWPRIEVTRVQGVRARDPVEVAVARGCVVDGRCPGPATIVDGAENHVQVRVDDRSRRRGSILRGHVTLR